MMHLSRAAAYGVGALSWMAKNPNGYHSVTEIREAVEAPPAFLSKVLRRVVRAGLAEGVRGRGYRLAKHPSQIDLLAIVQAIDGGILPESLCLMNSRDCVFRNDCSLSRACRTLAGHLIGVFSSITLESIPMDEASRPRCRSAWRAVP
jgi:Rrf2 family protein